MKKTIIFFFLLCGLFAQAQPTIWGGAKISITQGDTTFFGTANALATFVQEKDRAFGRATGQTAANGSVATLTVGAADASYMVSVAGLVTTSSGEIITVSVDYTDENSTARNLVFMLQYPGSLQTVPFMRFSYGAVSYGANPIHIRCKASTAITIKTTGTFTGCTYNIEGLIKKI